MKIETSHILSLNIIIILGIISNLLGLFLGSPVYISSIIGYFCIGYIIFLIHKPIFIKNFKKIKYKFKKNKKEPSEFLLKFEKDLIHVSKGYSRWFYNNLAEVMQRYKYEMDIIETYNDSLVIYVYNIDRYIKIDFTYENLQCSYVKPKLYLTKKFV